MLLSMTDQEALFDQKLPAGVMSRVSPWPVSELVRVGAPLLRIFKDLAAEKFIISLPLSSVD